MTPTQPDLFPTVQTIEIPLGFLDQWIADHPDKRIILLCGIPEAIKSHHWTAQITDRKPNPIKQLLPDLTNP